MSKTYRLVDQLIEHFDIDLGKHRGYLLTPEYSNRFEGVSEKLNELLEKNDDLSDEIVDFVKTIQDYLKKDSKQLYWN